MGAVHALPAEHHVLPPAHHLQERRGRQDQGENKGREITEAGGGGAEATPPRNICGWQTLDTLEFAWKVRKLDS